MDTPVILENRIDDAVFLLTALPEFEDTPDANIIRQRIGTVPHLVLTAYLDHQPCGFKIGYEREGHFYSWLGGVLPAYRRYGIAGRLADYQEAWAAEHGYSKIWMKTRNRFPDMLIMAVRRGFRITSVVPREDIREHRIVLEKSI